MTYRPITDTYTVAGQIAPEDVAQIAALGYTTLIDNRPDTEAPRECRTEAMQAAAEDAGMTFVANPFSHAAFSMDLVDRQAAALEASTGPVFAYCASGNRSTILWAIGQVKSGARSIDDVVSTAAAQGYDLSGLAPQLKAMIG